MEGGGDGDSLFDDKLILSVLNCWISSHTYQREYYNISLAIHAHASASANAW